MIGQGDIGDAPSVDTCDLVVGKWVGGGGVLETVETQKIEIEELPILEHSTDLLTSRKGCRAGDTGSDDSHGLSTGLLGKTFE
jgi:hypothetical protein